jgi:hypothetical protein
MLEVDTRGPFKGPRAYDSLGLIERQGDRYQNGVVAAAFLAGAGGPDMRPMPRDHLVMAS